MNETTFVLTVDIRRVLPITNLLQISADMLCADYKLEERTELTIRTNNPAMIRLLEILNDSPMVKADQPVPNLAANLMDSLSIDMPAPDGDLPAAPEPVHVIELPRPELGPDPHGLTAANLAEKTVVCVHCTQQFIRTRKDQVYCKKPECQRALYREYQRKYKERQAAKA